VLVEVDDFETGLARRIAAEKDPTDRFRLGFSNSAHWKLLGHAKGVATRGADWCVESSQVGVGAMISSAVIWKALSTSSSDMIVICGRSYFGKPASRRLIGFCVSSFMASPH
jgi:hypothetical protein